MVYDTERNVQTEQKGTLGAASGWFAPSRPQAGYGDLALILLNDDKRYLVKLEPRQRLDTHLGIFAHDELVGLDWGALVRSQAGHQALLLEPSLEDLIRHLKRGTQIIYPKDAVYLVHRLNLHAGSRVIEAGTGSGGLTAALAWAVAPTGRVYTYEVEAENFHLARRNLERVALLPYVEMHLRSISSGFSQSGVDALFLDVRDPWRFLGQARAALRRGGFFAALLPTMNQVVSLLTGFEQNGFADVTVEEVLVRAYKPVPERLRPEDEMVAHTGYLIAARLVQETLDPTIWMSKERRRYLARQQAKEKQAAAEAARAARGDEEGPPRKYPRLPLPG